jgi:hypothetical protein
MQTSSQERESCALITLWEDERPKRMSSHRASGSECISHWPTEITRWIARWENEGGAVLKEAPAKSCCEHGEDAESGPEPLHVRAAVGKMMIVSAA